MLEYGVRVLVQMKAEAIGNSIAVLVQNRGPANSSDNVRISNCGFRLRWRPLRSGC
jgi:hypothetical protein